MTVEVGEEIERVCKNRGIDMLRIEEASGRDDVMDKVFQKVVSKIGIGEKQIVGDPVLLLGKGVDVGPALLNGDNFLQNLFTSPS